ncbi:MAG: VWA domain-containing protein [Bacteroidota bacterium]
MTLRYKTLIALLVFLPALVLAHGNGLPKDEEIVTKADKPHKAQHVKIALLLDTSNSMDGLIDQAKSQLWDIVNEFTYAKCNHDQKPQLQIALFEYGNDRLSSRTGYVREVLSFSNDLDDISEKLFSLTTNGGEEYCGTVISTSLERLDWGNNSEDLKLIFIAGNEPFTQGKLDYRDAVAQAKEQDVVVNTIFCGNYEQGINSNWKDGASLTGGDYIAIDHNQQLVHIATPYDKLIIELNSRLNGTYISYGALGTKRLEKQALQDQNAQVLNESVVIKRAVSKSSRLYNNATWDLVDAVEEEAEVLDNLPQTALPKELKGKTKAEIQQYIASKKEERQALQQQINELNKKRNAHIKNAQKAKGDQRGELENAMLAAIKKQAAKKNYTWK